MRMRIQKAKNNHLFNDFLKIDNSLIQPIKASYQEKNSVELTIIHQEFSGLISLHVVLGQYKNILFSEL
ncbi:MAG: hypothetical protein PSN36_07080 [Gammaproteobacteria bacterium]|nr:hypothetical protein [Gammaproteobacteria bacterium]